APPPGGNSSSGTIGGSGSSGGPGSSSSGSSSGASNPGSSSGSQSSGGSSGAPADAGQEAAPVSCNDPPGPTTCGTNPIAQSFSAGLTFYQQTAANNCAVPWPSDGMYVALSTNLYDQPAGSSACGKCVQVNGKTLVVVDQCPSSTNAPCTSSHLDLSPTAYTAVQGSQNPGSVPNSPGVSVKFVPCPVTGPIQYSFTSSTQQFYMAMVITNAKYGIQKVEYRPSGTCTWTALPARTDADAHWILNATVPAAIDFRVTDEWGHVLIDKNIQPAASKSVAGAAQFPTCP
ncbi:MAG: hypothetical protein JOZ69_12630, partial [Myxococcales bacterium]|nr:hypothetical protein [Myxococcales bacterium]